MSAAHAKTVAVVLSTSTSDESTTTALKLIERIGARGHRVTVYAHEAAAGLTAGDGEAAAAIRALLRRGVHPPTLDWVVDAASARRLRVGDDQAAGVVQGDPSDLWAFVRAADVVLAPGQRP